MPYTHRSCVLRGATYRWTGHFSPRTACTERIRIHVDHAKTPKFRHGNPTFIPLTNLTFTPEIIIHSHPFRFANFYIPDKVLWLFAKVPELLMRFEKIFCQINTPNNKMLWLFVGPREKIFQVSNKFFRQSDILLKVLDSFRSSFEKCSSNLNQNKRVKSFYITKI